ncbi:MAG: EamA family transporter [Acidobacteriota bacterium]
MARWLWLSILAAALFGVWGALIELPEKHFQPGFPATLGYVVWSLTMLPCALLVLRRIGWRMDRSPKAIWYGAVVGLLGAAGQLALFKALMDGPAYLVFPVISLVPTVTIVMSVLILRERAHALASLGVLLSLVAIFLLSLRPSDTRTPLDGHRWLFGAAGALVMWGMQSYFVKASAGSVSSESLFCYMTVSALVLAPVAWSMTDWSLLVNWGLSGPYLTALIQMANSVGALVFVFALRSGKALLVAPTVNGLYPVITIVLSLVLYTRRPEYWNGLGMVLAVAAVMLMSYGETLSKREVIG